MRRIKVFDRNGLLRITAVWDEEHENVAITEDQAERSFVFGHLRIETVSNDGDEE